MSHCQMPRRKDHTWKLKDTRFSRIDVCFDQQQWCPSSNEKFTKNAIVLVLGFAGSWCARPFPLYPIRYPSFTPVEGYDFTVVELLALTSPHSFRPIKTWLTDPCLQPLDQSKASVPATEKCQHSSPPLKALLRNVFLFPHLSLPWQTAINWSLTWLPFCQTEPSLSTQSPKWARDLPGHVIPHVPSAWLPSGTAPHSRPHQPYVSFFTYSHFPFGSLRCPGSSWDNQELPGCVKIIHAVEKTEDKHVSM